MSAIDRYRTELSNCETQLHRQQLVTQRLVFVRMVLFLAAAYFLLTYYLRTDCPSWWMVVGWTLAIAFIVAAAVHEAMQQSMQGNVVRSCLYRRLLGRAHRNWKELPKISPADLDDATSITADDLDIVGAQSLMSWCSLAGTKTGLKMLARQLTTFADANTVEQRRIATQELAPQFEMRQRLMLLLWALGVSQASLEGFSQWATTPVPKRRWLDWLTWIGPLALLLGTAIAVINYQRFPGPVFWSGVVLAGVGLLTNIVLLLGYIGVIYNAFKQIETHRGLEATCQELLRSLIEMRTKSSLLMELRQYLCDVSNQDSALAALAQLRWPMRLAGLRLNPVLFVPFLIFQVIFLWDFRVYNWIERWRTRYSNAVARWLECIGQLEVTLSAAAIHDEYPHWAFAKSELSTELLFRADKMGHPLIDDECRTVNDVCIRRDHPLLLVTGSNMSGKSTLMRSIGVNVALSRIGSPVCAVSFQCQPMELATSIRVRDSLAEGVSFFMAELNRLKQVVDTVQQNFEQHRRASLVILDEILQGTNSRERQIAVGHVVQKLLGFQAVLMVSTHDLQLADVEGFREHCGIVHFREHFEEIDGQLQMKFDYKMHPGIAPTTNALKLLELVGLGSPNAGHARH
ncbi:MAG: hypothetical protein SGI77_26715 [Pirellulaceae bacterium]|nr:hypothetical protein [Pirellulaceae bacterium]